MSSLCLVVVVMLICFEPVFGSSGSILFLLSPEVSETMSIYILCNVYIYTAV